MLRSDAKRQEDFLLTAKELFERVIYQVHARSPEYNQATPITTHLRDLTRVTAFMGMKATRAEDLARVWDQGDQSKEVYERLLDSLIDCAAYCSFAYAFLEGTHDPVRRDSAECSSE